MKTTKTTAIFSIKAALMLTACFIAGNAKSQLYGEYGYGITNYRLCSGKTGINYPARPGLVMAGNAPVSGLPNQFTVVRTDEGGRMTASTWVFANEYQILFDPVGNCGMPTSIATDCYGVSVIETNLPAAMGIRYVAAGAFNGGVFYAELSPTGVVVNSWYHFNTATAAQLPSKPVICESTVNPGEYYIAGYDGTQLYAFKYVAGATSPAASQFYGQGSRMPKAILMSPYGTNDITIVGEEFVQASTLQDAFFLQLDNASLMPTNYTTYDYNNTDQGFTSIDIANSNNPSGPGFIVGGHCQAPVSSNSWFVKLGPNGNLNGFSNIIVCTNDPQTGTVAGIVERLNTNFKYEYYGALVSNFAVLVVKLDDNGFPFAAGEYKYQTGSSGNAYAVGLSCINAPSPDEGLQIYIAASGVNPNDIYSAQSCFSGNSGCSIINGVLQVLNVPPSVNLSSLLTNGTIPGCYNSGLVINSTSVNLTMQPCGAAPYIGAAAAGGNNFRPAVATGISQVSADNTGMQVYPSPATDKVQVTFKSNAGSAAKIDVFDYSGRLVTSMPLAAEAQAAEIDFKSLHIESGIYVISAKINGSSGSQKIIYTKE